MIISFSKNPLRQIQGIVFWNRRALIFFATCAVAAYLLCIYYGYDGMKLPAIPVSILGGALAIFLGFRNSSAYDRWWEARKVWGSVVNNSRSLGLELITYPIGKTKEDEAQISEWRKAFVLRHIAWLYALRGHLRKSEEDLTPFISDEEIDEVKNKQNIPAQLLALQGKEISKAFEKGWIEEFRFNALIATLKKLYDDQGKAERIKNTIFPYYYNYFTLFFLWLFTMSLPFALASLMDNWMMIPVSILISFAFYILNKAGVLTETPFEHRAADTPLSAICRTIEIDLLEMLDTEDHEIPDSHAIVKGKFGVTYQN